MGPICHDKSYVQLLYFPFSKMALKKLRQGIQLKGFYNVVEYYSICSMSKILIRMN